MSILEVFDGSEVLIDLKERINDLLNNDFEVVKACDIVCRATGEILKEYYKTSMPIIFPIDIRGIVKYYNIHIYETNLNSGIGFRIEKINGYYRKTKTGNHEINLENRDSEFTKRYILAHEFGHFIAAELLNQENSSMNSYCTDPFFPKRWMEIFSDLVATFLMFPPIQLLSYLEKYTERLKYQNNYPIDSSAWLTDLGRKAQIPLYFTISSYQYIKLYMCWLYNHQDSLEKIMEPCDVIKFKGDYKKFFK